MDKLLFIALLLAFAVYGYSIAPVAPVEINNHGYWLTLRAVSEYAGIKPVKSVAGIVIGKYTFKKDEIKIIDGIGYVKSELLVNVLGGERIFRPDINRTIIDAPGMPVPLSLELCNNFPIGDKLYLYSDKTLNQISIVSWSFYSNSLPAFDRNYNIYWVNKGVIYYKPVDAQNYQDIFHRADCSIKICGFDKDNNLICEVANNKPGEHEIIRVKNDGTSRLITKGFSADVSSSGEMLGFCRRISNNSSTTVYLKSLVNESDEIVVHSASWIKFALDSASFRYFSYPEIVRVSLINGTPGKVISSLSTVNGNDWETSGWSYDNQYIIGHGAAGIFISPADKPKARYLTGNPDDPLPTFWGNDVLFLRNNRLMKIPVSSGDIESEIFPGMSITNYKIPGEDIVFTAWGKLNLKNSFKIDVNVDNIIKVVERIAGRSANNVQISEITPENAAGIIAKKNISTMQKEAWQHAVNISQGILGIYDDQSDKIFIIPENIHKIAGAIDEKLATEYILAHELTHKLQNDVNSFRPGDYDGQLAWAAVTEGQAALIAEKYAVEMKITPANIKKINDYSRNIVPDKLSDNTNIAGKMVAEIYDSGYKFMKWQMMNGGNERMWQIIKNPPATTDVLYKPQNYPKISKSTDYSYLLSDINKMFPGKTVMMNTNIGTLAQKVVYNKMDTTDKPLLDHIKAIQVAAIDTVGIVDHTASVSVIILDDTKLTGKFIVAAEKIAFKKNPKLKVNSFVNGDIAGRKILNGKSSLYRIFYKDAVIEINSNGIILTDLDAAKIMRMVISKLKQR